jgi:hypothetical protein
MKFAYTRRGGPLLDWSGPTPPYPTRAGETRSLGDFYPTVRTSSALRRYGARGPRHGGAAVNYEHSRSLGSLDVPRPGAPEVIGGYEPPQPGAAIIHLGGYIPEGAARTYGQQMLGADPEQKPTLWQDIKAVSDSPLYRKTAAAAAAYHGVKQHNGSILWGALWAVGGYSLPTFTIFAALAQRALTKK